MKKFFLSIAMALMIGAMPIKAQSVDKTIKSIPHKELLAAFYQAANHSAQLTWTASVDGGTVNVYRGSGACTASPTFTAIKSGVTAGGPYTDTTITVGAWCYYVTAVVGSAESAASNKITLTVLPQPPGGLAGSAN